VANLNENHPVDETTILENTESVEKVEVEPVEDEIVEDFIEAEDEIEGGYSNAIGRMLGIILDPVRAMKDVVVKRGWLVPLIFFVLALVIFNLVAGGVVSDFAIEQGTNRINDMVEQGRINQEQADQIIQQQMGGPFMKIMMYANPLVSIFLVKLIVAALALLIGNIVLGGDRKFKNYWSTVWYAGVIGSLGMIISAILIAVTNDIAGAQLGLGILTKGDPTSTIHKIAQSFNVFTIWESIILGIGVALQAKVSLSKGIAWIVIIMLGFSIVTSLLFGQPLV